MHLDLAHALELRIEILFELRVRVQSRDFKFVFLRHQLVCGMSNRSGNVSSPRLLPASRARESSDSKRFA